MTVSKCYLAVVDLLICLMLICSLNKPTNQHIGKSNHAQNERAVAIKHTDRQGRVVTLAGTLTLPKGKAPKGGWPAMVMITGSGSQNRDEELMGHKPFKVIADYMASNGIATLRCDDRGVGGSSGAFDDITPYDLVADIEAQWRWLTKIKNINPDKIGLIGHSEGGMLAPMAAVENPRVAFVVMLAGPALPMQATLLEQNKRIFALRGVEDSLINRRLDFMVEAFASAGSMAKADTTNLVDRLNRHYRALKDSIAAGLSKEQKQKVGLTTKECYGWAVTMASPYMRAQMGIRPGEYLERLSCPLFALNGELDCQVDAKSNLEAVRQACKEKKSPCHVWLCTGMNHLFQYCQTGAIMEYAHLGQSPADDVLESIKDWILGLW